MLFLLNTGGVPSVARWIRLDAAARPPPDLSAAAGTGAPRDTTRPRILSVRLTRRQFRTRVRAGPGHDVRPAPVRAEQRHHPLPKGAPRPQVGRRCAKPTRRNRRLRVCTRFLDWGPDLRTKPLRAGASKARFSGKLGRRRLASGRWRAFLVATDAAGNRSRARAVRFRVLRRS